MSTSEGVPRLEARSDDEGNCAGDAPAVLIATSSPTEGGGVIRLPPNFPLEIHLGTFQFIDEVDDFSMAGEPLVEVQEFESHCLGQQNVEFGDCGESVTIVVEPPYEFDVRFFDEDILGDADQVDISDGAGATVVVHIEIGNEWSTQAGNPDCHDVPFGQWCTLREEDFNFAFPRGRLDLKVEHP